MGLVDKQSLDLSILTHVYEASDITCAITAEAARDTGLEPGTPVAAGGGDQASSAVGNGIVVPGLLSCTLGPSGVVFAPSDQPHYYPAVRPHTFCHAVKGAWHSLGVTQCPGLRLHLSP